ncbi:MAG: glutaredoxin family protein [Thiomonas sp.]
MSMPPVLRHVLLSTRPALLATAVALLAALAAPSAWAVYKVVGPNGQITFTDIPPSRPGEQVERIGTPAQAQSEQGASRVPADLQPVVRKYPVVIYTTPQCPACDDGVHLLRQRGIPYSDKSVATPADVTAYKRISDGSEKLPLLTVAGVRLPVGFAPDAWNQALTAAGYPQQSRLPKDFAFAAPEDLVPVAAASRPAKKASNPEGLPAAPVLPPPNPKAPPGFQF